MPLSKTHILAGLQCIKRLYLAKHHPELANQEKSPAVVTGQVVGSYARTEYPGGILVERNAKHGDACVITAELMHDGAVPTLFEAGFRSDDLVVFVDILRRNDAEWDLIEVKAATRVEDHHIADVAIQAYVLMRCNIPVRRYCLMHVSPEFFYQGNGDYQDLFVREDISEQVRAHLPAIAASIAAFKQVLAGSQPDLHIGSHCKQPYQCEFLSYCESGDAEYPVAWLPRGQMLARKLVEAGIYDIRDISATALKSETHQRIRRVTLSGKPELLPGADVILGALKFPRYFLDFESIQFAIPIWAGTRPYEQLPFQWSCHVQIDPDTLLHHEFLDTSGNDPRRKFAEALIAACGESGPILVYNQSFEKGILSALANELPDLADRMLELKTRIFDLLPVVKDHYYHPAMKGSWSIKAVLPHLVPALKYSDLGEVQDGTQAQAVYLDIISGSLEADDRARLIQDLKNYCRLDTLAMVKIVEHLMSVNSGCKFGSGQ